MDLSELELTTIGVTDAAEIQRISTQRWYLRRARLQDDQRMDPRLRELYLDRTIWNTERAAAEFGWDESSIGKLRAATPRLGGWSASAYPDLDNEFGTADAGVEAGRLREWAEMRGSHDVDPKTGRLIKRPGGIRHGRSRSRRGALTKATYQLGQPRAGKKDTPVGPKRKYTDEHIEQIRTLVAQGKSDAEIAETIGDPFLDKDGQPDAKKVERQRWRHRISRQKTE